jgi:soluble lytic murein transglycosylase-like protein
MIASKLILATLITMAVVTAKPALHDAIPAQAATYRAQVVREAHAAGGLGAPVPMFAAQIHQESGWKPTARSGVGAMGLAQFMPGTADWIANLYPADLKPGAPLDPNWAIRALVRYDYWLYKRVPKFQKGDERWAAALASYNAGLGWIQKDQGLVSCDASKWFGCVENAVDKRTADNRKQSRDYPVRILLKLRPLYQAAKW